MRPQARLWGALLALVFSAGAQAQPMAHELPLGPNAWVDAELEGIRGVTVGPIESIQQPGRGYGTRHSAELLDHLVERGTNWISITPFGRIWSLQDTEIQMDFEAPYAANRVAIQRMIRQAKARGLKVLLIPHLWVETEGWRGEIDPGTEEGWDAYRESYRQFVLRWARDAQAAGADALSIGVECKSWSGRFGAFWTDFIAEVRETFDGLLTYSANWDEAEAVFFWDQLDFIGINAFYPLADHEDATDAEYLEGAEALVPSLEELTEVLQMPLVFVEVGYTTREDAAVEPWLWPDGMADVVIDEREQARAVACLLDPFLRRRFFAGFFYWRYYANLDDVSQEGIWGFSPHGKLAANVLEDLFTTRWAVDPAAPLGF